MQVLINGIPYEPASARSSGIGIAITTHNRPDVLARALEQHQKHLPPGAVVVIVDDGSVPAAVAPESARLIRHEQSHGIVASKNASIEALIDAGCEHYSCWTMTHGRLLMDGMFRISSLLSLILPTSFSTWQDRAN